MKTHQLLSSKFLFCLDQKVRKSSARMRPILAPSSTGQELQHKVSRHSPLLSTPRLFLQIYIHLQLLKLVTHKQDH